MKKLLFGCLGIAVLAAILFAVGSYILYRAASPVFDSARSYLSGLSKISELDKEIVNQSPYAAPVSGELTESQVARFARVQDSVQQVARAADERDRGQVQALQGATPTTGSSRRSARC